MNKKFIFPLFVLFISSFFLLSPNVRAEEYTYTIPDDVMDYLVLNSNKLNDIGSELLTSYSDFSSNFISFYCISCNSSNAIQFYLFNDNYTIDFYHYNTDFRSSSSITFKRCFYSLDLNFTSCSERYSVINYLYSSLYPLTSSSNLVFSPSHFNSDLYIFSYKDKDYQILNDGSNYLPTLYDLDQHFNSSPPVPPDDTPLLTSFIDISIEKLAVICNFITSSYIYLAPFVIFIFYFVILLLRRFR